MAEILFGKASVRLSVNKVWRKLASPDILHGSVREREKYIYKVKSQMDLDNYLRHSIRKMSQGSQMFWKYPVWVIRPVRAEMPSNPNVFPLEYMHSDGTPIESHVGFENVNEDYEKELRLLNEQELA